MSLDVSFSNVLWMGAAAGQALALALLVLRKLVWEFPAFFVFLGFHVLLTILLWWFRPYYPVPFSRYFYTFWIGHALDAILRFIILYELYSRVFDQYEGLKRLGNITFRWGAAVLILLAFAFAAALPNPDTNRIMRFISLLDRGVSMVQCGLVFLLFLFASQLRIFLRRQVLGVALGFGLIACIDLTVLGLRTHFGPDFDPLFSYVRRSTYVCALGVWIMCLVPQQRTVASVGSLPDNNLAEWNRALLQLLNS
jgi:hypothetical protein